MSKSMRVVGGIFMLGINLGCSDSQSDGGAAGGGPASGGAPAASGGAGGATTLPSNGGATLGGASSGGKLGFGGIDAGGSGNAGAAAGAQGGLIGGGGTSAAAGGSATGGAAAQGGSNNASGGKTAASGGSAGATNGGSTNGGSTNGGSTNGGSTNGGSTNGGTASGGAQSSCASNQRAVCTGTNPISCHFGGDPGNYEVSVALGGAQASDGYVEVESYRRMLAPTTTTPGQTKNFTFVVNVRQPEGQPVQNGANDGTPGLDVYIRGTAPKLDAICFRAAPKPAMVWIAGDSTVCDQSGTDYAGWGQHLPQFFDAPVSIANYADSGESSGSFLNSAAMFGAIKARWHAGDWLLLQMGHNDKTTTAATFEANMKSYVTQAKSAGVNVVLLTPISRVGYALADEHVNETGANLPQIVRDLAKSQNVPLIDLTVTTWNWIQTITWQDYFALGTDHTHTNPKGAGVIAGFVRDAIKSQKLGIATYLRP